MFKVILYLILFAVVGGLLVGGGHLLRVAYRNKKEMSRYEGPAVVLEKPAGKVLVVYYSLSGHTREIAEKIRTETGADIYEIKVGEKLPSGLFKYMLLRRQLKSGNYPKLAGRFPDFSAYDFIFVGAPVWWYTMATPLWAFLEQADFAGRKVIPFSTQGSNPGTYFEDFAAHAKNAELLKSAAFNNLPAKYNHAVDNKIRVWLNSLW